MRACRMLVPPPLESEVECLGPKGVSLIIAACTVFILFSACLDPSTAYIIFVQQEEGKTGGRVHK